MKSIGWSGSEDLGVIAAFSKNKSISIGRSTASTGSYATSARDYGIAGAGIVGYTVVNACPSQISQIGPGTPPGGPQHVPGPSLNIPFTTSSGDLVLIVVGGQGTGFLTLSGIPAATLQNQTYSEGGSEQFASGAIYSAGLSDGSYVATCHRPPH